MYSSAPYRTLIAILISIVCSPAFTQTPVSIKKPTTEASQSSLRFTGTITSKRMAALSPRVAGLIAKADAEMGREAQAGDILLALDDTLARMDLKEKELDLETARAELSNAKRRLDDAISLGDANFPRSEREDRETAYRKAQIEVDRLTTIMTTQKEIVERHLILAPFDGIVAEKMAEVGEWAQTGRPLLNFVDTKNLRLDVQIPQEQLEVVLQAKGVSVIIAGSGADAFDAQVEAFSPQVDATTRTFQARIQLQAPSQSVRAGMSAEAIFKPRSDQTNLFITRDAILRAADGRVIVWVANKSGEGFEASRRVVELGPTSGDLIEVVSGLAAEDQIIYQGNETLQEGQEIQIVDSVIPIAR
ncbi:MAG: efflux RND transporter periplasmic adaptor subunit [Verrucomicrobiota bacterium]